MCGQKNHIFVSKKKQDLGHLTGPRARQDAGFASRSHVFAGTGWPIQARPKNGPELTPFARTRHARVSLQPGRANQPRSGHRAVRVGWLGGGSAWKRIRSGCIMRFRCLGLVRAIRFPGSGGGRKTAKILVEWRFGPYRSKIPPFFPSSVLPDRPEFEPAGAGHGNRSGLSGSKRARRKLNQGATPQASLMKKRIGCNQSVGLPLTAAKGPSGAGARRGTLPSIRAVPVLQATPLFWQAPAGRPDRCPASCHNARLPPRAVPAPQETSPS